VIFAVYQEPGEDKLRTEVVLDLRRVVKERWSLMLPLVYPEDVGSIAAAWLPMPGNRRGVDRLLDLVNYLDVNSIILLMPSSSDLMMYALDVAADYGVSIAWFLRDPVNYSPPAAFPHPVKIAFSIPSLGSMKSLAKFILLNQSSIKFMFAYNVQNGRGGLPLMGGGAMDYLIIIKLLAMIGYEDYFVLQYDKQYRSKYLGDIDALETYRDSLGGALADARLVKLLSSALGEVFGDNK